MSFYYFWIFLVYETVSYIESSFYVIAYLTCKWFEFLFFFYLTSTSLSDYLYFPNNIKDF